MDAAQIRRWQPMLMRGRWFAALPPDDQARLQQAGRLLRLPAGALLFARGDANSGLYCVLEGAVRVGASDDPGRDAVLSLLSPPQWFGEIACLDGGPRTHDASTTLASTLLLVPQAVLAGLAEADPRWWRHLGQLLAEKVRALFAGLDELTQLPAPSRLARRLVAMAQGHGMLAPGVVQRQVVVSQAQLGAMLSLSRQTVSEVLGEFEARGWVRRGYGAVELLDWEALAAAGRPG